MTTDNLDEAITDLPKEISILLANEGCSDTESWKRGLASEALSNPDVNVQRFLINRCWRQILLDGPAALANETREARMCLLDTPISPSDYLGFFKTYVIPCVLKHNLLHTVH